MLPRRPPTKTEANIVFALMLVEFLGILFIFYMLFRMVFML